MIETLVAVIPRDKASLDYALEQNQIHKNPQPAEVYVSHYVLRGTALSTFNDVRNFAASGGGFPMQRVQISSLLPGSRLSGLTAPYLLVLGRHRTVVRPLA